MIEIPATLRCNKCGATRSVTMRMETTRDSHCYAYEGRIHIHGPALSFEAKKWAFNTSGEVTCPKCQDA